MKSTIFARFALFLPYLLLIESALYFVFRDVSEKDSLFQTINIIWNFLAIFWFIPYTILVIILLVRSKGKSFAEIKGIFRRAPFMMMIVAPGTYALILIGGSMVDLAFFENAWQILLLAMAVSIPASLLFGYIFLGLSLLLHKLLLKTGVVTEDDSQYIHLEPEAATV
jgi:hypothetical protein